MIGSSRRGLNKPKLTAHALPHLHPSKPPNLCSPTRCQYGSHIVRLPPTGAEDPRDASVRTSVPACRLTTTHNSSSPMSFLDSALYCLRSVRCLMYGLPRYLLARVFGARRLSQVRSMILYSLPVLADHWSLWSIHPVQTWSCVQARWKIQQRTDCKAKHLTGKSSYCRV